MGAILISGSPGIADENERDKRIQSDRDWIRMLKDPTMGIEAFCAAWETQAVIQPQTRLPAPLAMQLKLRRRNNSPVGLANSLTAVGTGALPSLWGRLDQLPGIQLVTGEQDMKFRRIAQEMTSLNPQFQTWVIPESGHSPHLEQPHRLARDLRLFI